MGLTNKLTYLNDIRNHIRAPEIINNIELFQSQVIDRAMTQASEQMFHVCPFHWTVDKMLLADAPICKGIH